MQNNKNIQIAIQRIEEVRSKKLFFLDLKGLLLHSLPCSISDLNFLFDIDLSYNNFSSIPDEIIQLENLMYLNVSNNNISFIDFEFGRNYALKELDITNNFLNIIPDSLSYLNEDVLIHFLDNPFLKNLPIDVEYQSFGYVKYYLDLINNHKEGYRLYETKLIFVGAGEVGKTSLMKTLKDDNYFAEIGTEPTTHGINIESFSYDVFFPTISPHYNSFKDIGNVYLKDIDFYEDENERSEEEIIYENYIDHNFNYEENDYYPIAEILSDFSEEEIAELLFLPDLSHVYPESVIEKRVKINVWDFGGQEIYYATHQFFLTKKSIYIFVWEPRKDNNEEEFDYWLKTIQLLSADSPVIVVMNKSDIRYKNIDKINYNKKFKNILCFVSVSCVTRDGINMLENEIKKSIRGLKHIGDKIPESWIIVREKIKQIKSDYINYNKFLEVCKQNKQIVNKKEIDLFIEYLHDIGDVINFKEDSILRNLVIINPQWATKAVYSLIDTIEIQKNNGIFNVFELEKFLDSKLYPSDKHIELLQLMEKFDICFKLIGAKDIYVIPELLKTEISNVSLAREIEDNCVLKFQIYYNFMPHGIITKLICRLFNLIHKDCYWKNGVIFHHENSKGLVVSDRSKKTITITISGKQSSNLLAIIRNEIKNIHSDFNMFEKKDFTEKIPCNCNICETNNEPYFFSYDVLKNFIAKEKNIIDCHISTESIDIFKLILGYKTIRPSKKLIYEILSAASQLQGQKKIIHNNEDARNTFISGRLSYTGIVSKDQSNWGSSATGKSQGRLDIKIEDGEGNIVSIIEGLNLKNLETQNIHNHISKTINNYDPNGLPEKFICIYYDGKNFDQFSKKYFSYIVDDTSIGFINTTDESRNMLQNTEIIVLKSLYEKTSRKICLYHILINLG